MSLPTTYLVDFLLLLFFLTLIIGLAYFKKSKVSMPSLAGFYWLSFFYHLSFTVLFASFYAFILKGGDTIAYWQGANTLNNLFFESPAKYFECLFSSPSPELFGQHFNPNTGFPPGWIYRENEGWLVCKIASILSIISFKSYLAMSLIVGYFSFLASWRLMGLVARFKTHSSSHLLIAFMFIPSVCFWCTGISKDGFIFVLVLYLLIALFNSIIDGKLSLKRIVWIVVLSYFIFYLRSFVFLAILVAMIMAYGARLTKKFESNQLAKFGLRFFYLIGGLGILFLFFSYDAVTDIMMDATIIQQDFVNNNIYTGSKYVLSNQDISPIGLVKSFPQALFYGIYRPYLTESLSATLFLNGVESLLFLFFTFRFFVSFKIFTKIKQIRKNEFLMFALVFVLILGFMSGFTSVLFGVLVRIRAIILPFVYLVLTVSGKLDTQEATAIKNN